MNPNEQLDDVPPRNSLQDAVMNDPENLHNIPSIPDPQGNCNIPPPPLKSTSKPDVQDVKMECTASTHQVGPSKITPNQVLEAAPVRSYLNQKVTPVLLDGMRILAKEQPPNPLERLGQYLIERGRNQDS
ncbi:Set1 complex component sdc1 [Neolecta irregularis DAH-3]|uniref:Set1 complex component sdc1 n=1 Tax=Neolecta irregularis (strain DAH-3) TaxID=1198029 RepID=A0A1U7LH79_NEOID|nr:Set1 complex component sdc1 [Neolecta irregularis DAH-3]|eukprot:OLL22010.1 Set1 complex component sdc1 [Neolecta irregularis DAH-3]